MASEMGKVRLPLEQLEETLSKLTVPELQQRLKKRGLKKSGVKAKLIQRLAEVCFGYCWFQEACEGIHTACYLPMLPYAVIYDVNYTDIHHSDCGVISYVFEFFHQLFLIFGTSLLTAPIHLASKHGSHNC